MYTLIILPWWHLQARFQLGALLCLRQLQACNSCQPRLHSCSCAIMQLQSKALLMAPFAGKPGDTAEQSHAPTDHADILTKSVLVAAA